MFVLSGLKMLMMCIICTCSNSSLYVTLKVKKKKIFAVKISNVSCIVENIQWKGFEWLFIKIQNRSLMFNGQIIKYLHNLETIYFFHIKIDICYVYYVMANYYMYK